MFETTIEIVGVGLRKTGIGKSGKAYDFVEVAFKYPDKRMDGHNVGSCLLDGCKYEQYGVRLGSVHPAMLCFFKQDKKYVLGKVCLMG